MQDFGRIIEIDLRAVENLYAVQCAWLDAASTATVAALTGSRNRLAETGEWVLDAMGGVVRTPPGPERALDHYKASLRDLSEDLARWRGGIERQFQLGQSRLQESLAALGQWIPMNAEFGFGEADVLSATAARSMDEFVAVAIDTVRHAEADHDDPSDRPESDAPQEMPSSTRSPRRRSA